MTPFLDIFDCTGEAFIERCAANGVNRQTALDAYRSFYREGVWSLNGNQCAVREVAEVVHEHGTIKFTLKHGEGQSTESVIIPQPREDGTNRMTLCVSSQIGCAMGCTFCETAQLGLLKNLASRDIVEQWFVARHQFNTRIDNIVFMGMGEPMDNLDAVLQAIEILTDRNGPAIPPAHITVSTVGRCAGIERYIDFAARPGFRGLKLAVSINAPNDAVRREIMPINKAEPMDRLTQTMLKWPRRVLIEYVLIPGVNSDLNHADELADYLRPLRCTVNVIAYNPRRNSPWPAPTNEQVDTFVNRLFSRGLRVTTRRTAGRAVMAACGQLGVASQPRNSARPEKRFLECFSKA